MLINHTKTDPFKEENKKSVIRTLLQVNLNYFLKNQLLI